MKAAADRLRTPTAPETPTRITSNICFWASSATRRSDPAAALVAAMRRTLPKMVGPLMAVAGDCSRRTFSRGLVPTKKVTCEEANSDDCRDAAERPRFHAFDDGIGGAFAQRLRAVGHRRAIGLGKLRHVLEQLLRRLGSLTHGFLAPALDSADRLADAFDILDIDRVGEIVQPRLERGDFPIDILGMHGIPILTHLVLR